MKIICLIVFLIEINKEANALNCFKYNKGDDPKERLCREPKNVFCNIEQRDGVVEKRKCMGKTDGAGLEVKEGCLVMPEFIDTETNERESAVTACNCKLDNCNSNCTPVYPCTELTLNEKVKNYPKDFKYMFCDGTCTPSGRGGDQVTNSPATAKSNVTTAEAKNEDSKATEKLDASTVEDKGKGSQATKAATEEGKGKDSKATEKSEGATGQPESGTGAGEPESGTSAGEHESGCQRITNSFEKIFLFWVLANLVNGVVKLRGM